jgi:hypothetical protein
MEVRDHDVPPITEKVDNAPILRSGEIMGFEEHRRAITLIIRLSRAMIGNEIPYHRVRSILRVRPIDYRGDTCTKPVVTRFHVTDQEHIVFGKLGVRHKTGSDTDLLVYIALDQARYRPEDAQLCRSP